MEHMNSSKVHYDEVWESLSRSILWKTRKLICTSMLYHYHCHMLLTSVTDTVLFFH